MTRNGLTLIELLIVITIIAILAGAAMPYAQQYIEDTRIAKAKQDLDEIRNALVRYESDQNRTYEQTDISRLVGAYLNKAMADPWGSPYRIAPASSTCYSIGSDRLPESGDEIIVDFRPPLTISRAFWEDSNKNTVVDSDDSLLLRFTRPVRRATGDGPQILIANDDFVYSAGTPDDNYSDLAFSDFNMSARLKLNFSTATPFKPGLDTITVSTSNTIFDGSGNRCKSDQPTVIKTR